MQPILIYLSQNSLESETLVPKKTRQKPSAPSLISTLISILILTLSLSQANDCIACHPKSAKKCKTSNHFTLANSINITREAFGIEGSSVTLQTLPSTPLLISKPQDIVDDMLRRKCVKCHIGVESDKRSYNSRANICLACHQNHSEPKCQKSKIAISKCILCHNAGHIGMDYTGRFPHDFDKAYRAPISKDGNYPEQIGGIDYHHLTPDIHYTLGMSCVDCHTSQGGKDWERGAKCVDCHTPSPKTHPKYHQNISCSACHSSWGESSYGLSLLRDDTPSYGQWSRLKVGEDEYLTAFLDRYAKTDQKPTMPEWTTGEMKSGIWYSGYRYRRWEDIALANGRDGKIELIHPKYQYRISYRDAAGETKLNDIIAVDGRPIEAWVPYAPHTISKRTKSCEKCHDNPLLDPSHPMRAEIQKTKTPNRLYQATPLDPKQLDRLHSQRYRVERFKEMMR